MKAKNLTDNFFQYLLHKFKTFFVINLIIYDIIGTIWGLIFVNGLYVMLSKDNITTGIIRGDKMTKKEEAVKLIKEKINKQTFLTYKEIAEITGYHPKYILKLKKEVLNGTVSFVHGNKDRVPANIMSEEERAKIISLYKKSNVSIRKFCKFYNSRSYSCIYNLLKSEGLLKTTKQR